MLKSYKSRYKLQDTRYKLQVTSYKFSQDMADTKYQPQLHDYKVAEIKIQCALQLAYHQEYESSPPPIISVVMLINARYLQASVKSQ